MNSKVINFLKLIRWFHALLGILPFVALYGAVYNAAHNTNCNLSIPNFITLCLAVELLMMTGFILNDIIDRHIDKINKPATRIIGRTISVKSGWLYFSVISIILLLLSIYISWSIFPMWALICPIVYLTSLAYNIYLKRSPLYGNIMMAVITAGIPLVIVLYLESCIAILQNEMIYILIATYILLPFMIIIPRELSLDISDMEGDIKDGCRTLPIVIGIKKSKRIVLILLFITLVLTAFAIYYFPFLFLAFLPVNIIIIIYMLKLNSVNQRSEYIKMGRWLWGGMILSLIITTVICYN